MTTAGVERGENQLFFHAQIIFSSMIWIIELPCSRSQEGIGNKASFYRSGQRVKCELWIHPLKVFHLSISSHISEALESIWSGFYFSVYRLVYTSQLKIISEMTKLFSIQWCAKFFAKLLFTHLESNLKIVKQTLSETWHTFLIHYEPDIALVHQMKLISLLLAAMWLSLWVLI